MKTTRPLAAWQGGAKTAPSALLSRKRLDALLSRRRLDAEVGRYRQRGVCIKAIEVTAAMTPHDVWRELDGRK